MALVAIASFAYLFREVFYRLWMRYDDDVKTIM